MIVFDVKCEVLEPLTVTDTGGNEVTLAPGRYHLRGLDHLVHGIGERTDVTGTDLTFVAEGDGESVYTVSAENVARFLARDEVEVKI